MESPKTWDGDNDMDMDDGGADFCLFQERARSNDESGDEIDGKDLQGGEGDGSVKKGKRKLGQETAGQQSGSKRPTA